LTDFRNNTQISNFVKIHSSGQTGRQTDLNEANSRFPQFCERA